MNGAMELRLCSSKAGEGQGHPLELLILWDVPCSVPVSSFTGYLLPRDTTHPSKATSRDLSAALPQQLLKHQSPHPRSLHNPLQLYPAAFPTGERLLGKDLKGFQWHPNTRNFVLDPFLPVHTASHRGSPPSLSAFLDGAGAGQPPPASQPQTSTTSTHLFIELQLRHSFINLIHAIVFKEQKSWKEKRKNQKNLSHYAGDL